MKLLGLLQFQVIYNYCLLLLLLLLLSLSLFLASQACHCTPISLRSLTLCFYFLACHLHIHLSSFMAYLSFFCTPAFSPAIPPPIFLFPTQQSFLLLLLPRTLPHHGYHLFLYCSYALLSPPYTCVSSLHTCTSRHLNDLTCNDSQFTFDQKEKIV